MDTTHGNVENLKSLWRTVSTPFGAYAAGENFSYCLVTKSDWPNRLWFHQDVNQETLATAIGKLTAIPTRMLLPYWDIYESNSYQLLEENGFQKLFEQAAMYRKLNQAFPEPGAIQMRAVADSAEALLWTQLFTLSFGYRINPAQLLTAGNSTSFLLAYNGNRPVGTGALHRTNKMAGIHAVGIIPEMRKKGFAEQIMLHLLNQCVKENFDYACLQASDMGKGLYLKLGFVEQFKIRNYFLPNG